ncbi:hypothetical protein WJX77_000325 [Trebouxia sp. C0004]
MGNLSEDSSPLSPSRGQPASALALASGPLRGQPAPAPAQQLGNALGVTGNVSSAAKESLTTLLDSLDSIDMITERTDDSPAASGKYDNWELTAYRVSGPHLGWFDDSPSDDVEIWLLVLTAPCTENQVDSLHLFLFEDVQNLIGQPSHRSPAASHTTKVANLFQKTWCKAEQLPKQYRSWLKS